MPHFRVDDALHSHPKARKAGFEAMGMWVLAGSYCMAYLSDGFVPDWWVKEKPKGTALAKRLVAAGFWHCAEKDGEQGYQFHEFTGPGRNDSREQILAEREKWRKRKESQRASTPVSPVDIPGDTTRDTPMDSLRATRDPTQPNPTENFGYVPESASLSNARDAQAATPGADLVREIIPSTIPDSERTMLRIKASALLREGSTREEVSDGLQLYLAKPHLGAGALPSLVSEAVRSRTAPANGKTHKLRVLAELEQQERAQESAELVRAQRELT